MEMEELKPSGLVPKKLSEEKVLDSWSILIENGSGRGEELYKDFLKFVRESQVPEVEVKMVKVVLGWLKGIFGKERYYLMVENERLKNYKIHVCAGDYGNYLDAQWYLTCEPDFFSKAFKIGATIYTLGAAGPLLSFDIFDQQDSILTNCGIQCYFRVSRRDAEILAKEVFEPTGMEVKAIKLSPDYFDYDWFTYQEEWEKYFQELQQLPNRCFYAKHKIEGGIIPLKTVDVLPAYEEFGIEKERPDKLLKVKIGSIEEQKKNQFKNWFEVST